MLGRDAFGMLAGWSTTTFSAPYVYVACGTRAIGPVAVAVGAVVVGGLVVVAEGLEPPVYAGSVALSSDPLQPARLRTSMAAQDRAAVVCFNVGFLPIRFVPLWGRHGAVQAE